MTLTSAMSHASACQRAIGVVANFFTRNKAAAVVFTAWVSVFVKIYYPASPTATGAMKAGSQLADPDAVEPLDRASVLARAKSVPFAGKGNKTRKMAMSRDIKSIESKDMSSQLIDEDAAVVLKRFLEDQASHASASGVFAEDVSLAWQALSKLYTARGLHKDAAEAAKNAGTQSKIHNEELVGDDSWFETVVSAIEGEVAAEEGYLSLAQHHASYTKVTSAELEEDEVDPEAEVCEWLFFFWPLAQGGLLRFPSIHNFHHA